MSDTFSNKATYFANQMARFQFRTRRDLQYATSIFLTYFPLKMHLSFNSCPLRPIISEGDAQEYCGGLLNGVPKADRNQMLIFHLYVNEMSLSRIFGN